MQTFQLIVVVMVGLEYPQVSVDHPWLIAAAEAEEVEESQVKVEPAAAAEVVTEPLMAYQQAMVSPVLQIRVAVAVALQLTIVRAEPVVLVSLLLDI
jgi:hypothetical protein